VKLSFHLWRQEENLGGCKAVVAILHTHVVKLLWRQEENLGGCCYFICYGYTFDAPK
jgi:hypothetical protein